LILDSQVQTHLARSVRTNIEVVGMKMIWPVAGTVTRGFWYAASFYYLGRHYAIDIAAPLWTPVKASLFGTLHSGYDSQSGYFRNLDSSVGDGIIIRTCYRHLTGPSPYPQGTIVNQGQVIGYVGVTGNTTGPHLHFDMLVNKVIRDDSIVWKPALNLFAVDPQIYLGQEAALTKAEVEQVVRNTAFTFGGRTKGIGKWLEAIMGNFGVLNKHTKHPPA